MDEALFLEKQKQELAAFLATQQKQREIVLTGNKSTVSQKSGQPLQIDATASSPFLSSPLLPPTSVVTTQQAALAKLVADFQRQIDLFNANVPERGILQQKDEILTMGLLGASSIAPRSVIKPSTGVKRLRIYSVAARVSIQYKISKYF